MSVIRTFIAVESSETVRSCANSLIQRLKEVDAKVTWVAPAAMHWTLKFLGDVELTATAEVCRLVADAAAEAGPFEMEVQRAGAFPNVARPRTIWLAAGSGEEHMIALAEKIEGQLAKMGFKPERRRFRPHLTLGRVRGQQNLPALGEEVRQAADFAAGTMYVDEVLVLASHLDPKGPKYEVLGRAGLGAKV